ncbi:MAG: SPOR domain-containing protein [Rhodobacteraceae bacterium]|nr:SPOR domain-containing protein [Paracoccaceae bacterium]
MSGQYVSAHEPRSLAPLVNWAGAALSLGLVIGAGVWGYKLLVRDVTGVPVVRAVEGPMRIQPENPGGRQAAHQGLAVNEIAAQGTAGKPADRFVLAPAPIELGTQDAVPVAKEEQPEIVAPPPLAADEISDVEAFAAKLAGSAEPLAEPEPVKVAAPKATAEAVVPKIEGGLGRSLRPKLRPATLSKAKVVPATDTVARADTSAVDEVSEVPVGTRMVQLGAYASADIARSEWDKFTARFGDYLGDKTRVIQKAQSGGRTFYRLRAMGFADLSDARRLCSALKAQNADCIPVTAR